MKAGKEWMLKGREEMSGYPASISGCQPRPTSAAAATSPARCTMMPEIEFPLDNPSPPTYHSTKRPKRFGRSYDYRGHYRSFRSVILGGHGDRLTVRTDTLASESVWGLKAEVLCCYNERDEASGRYELMYRRLSSPCPAHLVPRS